MTGTSSRPFPAWQRRVALFVVDMGSSSHPFANGAKCRNKFVFQADVPRLFMCNVQKAGSEGSGVRLFGSFAFALTFYLTSNIPDFASPLRTVLYAGAMYLLVNAAHNIAVEIESVWEVRVTQ